MVSALTVPVSGGRVWLAGSRGRGSLFQEGASDWLTAWSPNRGPPARTQWKVSQVTRYAAIRKSMWVPGN